MNNRGRHFPYSGEPVGVSPRTIRSAINPGADAHRFAIDCGFAALEEIPKNRRLAPCRSKKAVRIYFADHSV
jgi:hypothetical protein